MNTQRHGIMKLGGIAFHHPATFWFGVIAVIARVIGHVPTYLLDKDNGYRLAGMPIDLPATLERIASLTIRASNKMPLQLLFLQDAPVLARISAGGQHAVRVTRFTLLAVLDALSAFTRLDRVILL